MFKDLKISAVKISGSLHFVDLKNYFFFSVEKFCIGLHFYFYFLLLIGLMEVSGARFYSAASVRCIAGSPPKGKPPAFTIHPPLPCSTAPTLSLGSSAVSVYGGFLLFVCLICSPVPPSPH